MAFRVSSRISSPEALRLLFPRSNHHAALTGEYSPVPEYPEILDESREGRRVRRRESWHRRVTSLPTVEQKAIEVNMPRYYGYWSLRLRDDRPTLLGSQYAQYATRTHLEDALPLHYYEGVEEEAAQVALKVEPQVKRLIDLNFNCHLNRKTLISNQLIERHKTQNFLLGLHRIMASASSSDHLKDSVVDIRPRVEAFWFLGGVPPDRILRKTRRNFPPTKDREDDPMERPVQGTSTPCLGVRVPEGLPEVVAPDDPLASSAPVPHVYLDPRAVGLRFGHKHATTVTGYWPGEAKGHSQLWFHSRETLRKFEATFGEGNADIALRQKAVVSSFCQALAHATYLGFGPVTELTYPIVQQSAITDGRSWNFCVYQLNTCALHSDRATRNSRNNVLWLGEEQSLFEGVDSSGVKGINPQVLTRLAAMYLKRGVAREDPTPYLGPFKSLAEHPAPEEYRDQFLSTVQHLFSGRPRHIPKPEMYLWEKIYKRDHNTRPYEPPSRFFQDHYRRKDPGQTRLDDHKPRYVPKALRKHRRVKHMPKIDSEHLFKYD